jgi:hypothetical protein
LHSCRKVSLEDEASMKRCSFQWLLPPFTPKEGKRHYFRCCFSHRQVGSTCTVQDVYMWFTVTSAGHNASRTDISCTYQTS